MIFMNEDEKMTLEYYDKTAKIRNNTHSDINYFRKEFNYFGDFFPDNNKEKIKIIDIGCGAGRDAQLFKEFKNKYCYIGIDISQKMIQEARKLVKEMYFSEMNMYKLSFDNNSFDGFWAACSLLHIPKSRILGIFNRRIDIVLGQIRKIVKPDGIGFISIKEGDGERIIYDKEGNRRLFVFYYNSEFTRILKKNRFEILKTERRKNGNENLLNYFVKVKK